LPASGRWRYALVLMSLLFFPQFVSDLSATENRAGQKLSQRGDATLGVHFCAGTIVNIPLDGPNLVPAPHGSRQGNVPSTN
jgi:hypothetical protein